MRADELAKRFCQLSHRSALFYEFYRILPREEIQQKYPEAMPFFKL